MNNKYKEYLKSNEWAQLKIDLFKLRGYRCERCNNKKKLQVHHLNYNNIFNEEPEDLIILCENCHKKEHKLFKNKKGKTIKILSLAQKLELKKRNKKAYKSYRQNL
ncbi:HNH endonuclease [Rhodobacteraceae phage LS06-2018-MD05]|nr:HNH endonuclease [Rhodobacteraceae phage LS06-2018-MD05]